MFSKTPFAAIPTIKLICGLGLCTIGGAMLYVYFNNNDDDEETKNNNARKPNGQIAKSEGKPAVAAKPTKPPKIVTIKVVVENKNIPLLLGRSGENLKILEERTKTKIEFRDKNDKQKYCEITGEERNVKEARESIMHEIERGPVKNVIIKVPQYCMGKIIGRCGDELAEICRQSNAKITIDPGEAQQQQHNDDNEQRSIQISGSAQQVQVARKLIEDKVAEEDKLRRILELAEQNREPRRSPANSVNSSMYSSQTSLNSNMPPREKILASKDKPMEVYVSAIASPTKFWVQILGKQTAKLNELVEEMTTYYKVKENRDLHKLDVSQLYIGQIVATMFKYDSKWYRAEVVNILPSNTNPNDMTIDLYFVDYGDSDYVTPDRLFELRTDFLTLRFQAVECFLANIKSMSVQDPDYWDRQSIEIFEDLTQVARWKKFNLRVVTYTERPKHENSSEIISVPGVELYDTGDSNNGMNVAHCLIMNGFALPYEEGGYSYQRSMSPERVLSPASTPTLPLTSPLIPPPPALAAAAPQPSATTSKVTFSNGIANENASEHSALLGQLKYMPKKQQNGGGNYNGVTDILNSERRQHNGHNNWSG